MENEEDDENNKTKANCACALILINDCDRYKLKILTDETTRC